MRKLFLGTLLCFICTIGAVSGVFAVKNLPYGYPKSDRTKECVNSEWRFYLGEPEAQYFRANTDDSKWDLVSIPHTLKLTDIKLDGYRDDVSQPTFRRTVGWYRKDIMVSKSNKKIFLEFEGAQQVTSLWVNGREVGVNGVGGYTPFYFDISKFVKRGAKNQVTILVDNRQNELTPPDPGSKDYVIFGGLYRDLYLVEKNPIHITSNLDSKDSGVTITTPAVDPVNGNATIQITTEVSNQSVKAQKISVVQRVVDDRSNVVLKMVEHITVEAGERQVVSQVGGIMEDVKFWNLHDPYLYKVNTMVVDDEGRALDVVDNRLGIRKIELNAERGLLVNGKEVKIVGFNRHQNFPYIGDAAPNSLTYRDMVQFKKLGLNAVRTSHYPQDDELIRACDELGILVYEEAPSWHNISKEEVWYDNLHRSMKAMIRNHKNSPSLFIWGAGINHRGAVAEMQFIAKEEDPTRLTASQNSRWNGWQTSSWTDLFVNMNYAAGIWEREEPQLAMEGWGGAKALAPYFREPKRVGMISWAAYAYYSFQEVALPSLEDRTHYSGVMDIFRYPRNEELMWYPSQMKVAPYIHICDTWTESLKTLTIYSNATQIEVLINGKSQGLFRPSTDIIYNGLTFPPYEIKGLDFEAGELTVIGYREGERMAQKSTFTPTDAVALRLFADELGIKMRADGNDIMIVHAEVVDKNGVVLRDFDGKVHFSVEGDASIVGDKDVEGANPCKVMVGAASALVRAGERAGEIKVTASLDGLKSSTITIESVEAQRDIVAANAYEIRDREMLMVDMGNASQTTQFGWTPWDGDSKGATSVYLRPAELSNYVAGGTTPAAKRSRIVDQRGKGVYKFTIAPASEDGALIWSGEMRGMGKNNNLFSDGVRCSGESGMSLKIEDLPAGDYSIKCYHNFPTTKDPKLVVADLPDVVEKNQNTRVNAMPFASKISVLVNGKVVERDVVVTFGDTLQYSDAATSTTNFTIAEGESSVELIFKSENSKSTGVWLNGFEFARHL